MDEYLNFLIIHNKSYAIHDLFEIVRLVAFMDAILIYQTI